MENNEAIGILRGTISPASVLHPQIAADLGAQALEAWAWVERTGELPYYREGGWVAVGKAAAGEWVFGNGTTPLAAVLDAMEKEKG